MMLAAPISPVTPDRLCCWFTAGNDGARPIAHRCHRRDTVRAGKTAVLAMHRHRNGCQCSTTAALTASRAPRWTDGASEIPIASADPGAQLPASSFLGGFRTPARSCAW